MLLYNISIIGMICDFVDEGLASATINDISILSIFNISIQYERNLFIHELNNNTEKTRKYVIELIHRERANDDKVIIKIEDKK